MFVTDCVPYKAYGQRAHEQRNLAHGHCRVLIFSTFGSKGKASVLESTAGNNYRQVLESDFYMETCINSHLCP